MAQVSWNRQLALAVALFGLGTAAYWLEYKHKPEKEALEEKTKKLFQLKESPVKSITLISDGTKTTFSCLDLSSNLCKPGDHSKWELLEPIKLKADDTNVNSLLSALTSANSENTIDLKDESPEKRNALLKEYGLDAEARKKAKVIKISTEAGDSTLYLGGTHPIGQSFFVMKESSVPEKPDEGTPHLSDKQVYLVSTYFKNNLEHDLKYWRDKKLVTLSNFEVGSLDIDGQKGQFNATRKEGHWVLQEKAKPKAAGAPVEYAGDQDSIDQLLSAVTYLSAKEFISEKKDDAKAKALMKGKPALTLTLQKEKKPEEKEAPKPVQLEFYSKNSNLYAAVSNLDPLFEVDASVKDRLDKALKDLRMTKLVTQMDRFSAKRLEFSGKPIGVSPLILTNTEGKWLLKDTQVAAADSKVTQLLEKLTSSKIQDFLTGSAIPSGENEGLHFILGDEKDPSKRQFAFWKNDKKVYAKDLTSKKKEAFVVDSALGDALPWNAEYFHEKKEEPQKAETTTPAPVIKATK